MLAIDAGLYQTCPRFGKLPTILESWCLPLVIARRVCGLRRTLVSIYLFLKTEIVD